MNIIFGEALGAIPENYTVLELDTFVIPPSTEPVTSYCVLEKLPLIEFTTLDAYQKIHTDLMQAYRDQNWEYCVEALSGLTGHWGGELDTFYANLAQRVLEYQATPPAQPWTGFIVKS